MTAEIFDKGMIALADHFGKKLSDFTREAYWQLLQGLSDDAWKKACGRAAQAEQFFPTAEKLKEYAAGGSAEARAEIAWQEVVRLVRSGGSYSSVHPDDPVTSSVIRQMGGWIRLCETPTDDFYVWKRKEFLEIYKSLSTQQHVQREALMGRHEQQNKLSGWWDDNAGTHRLGALVEKALLDAGQKHKVKEAGE